MNEEKQIRYSKYLIISFALIAVLIIFFELFCGGTSGNNNDVQGTVQRIADDNKQTGKSVDRAVEHVGTAADELERAEEANRRAAFILSEDNERANACAGIIVEFQKNNSRAKQILADVELSNKTRKVQK
ncbi:hypothetical protein [Phascolarctobacterium faecium]|uniref:hypothetical protein n=1 Tax=Phascolarctobacterium faecium TaxID=33025 RepID=UPI003FF05E42